MIVEAARAAGTLGVGFLGAGPVTQAIHLPTLATMAGSFHVAHVMDVDPGVARRVALGAGARASTEAEAVLDDPAVEIVAICSPNAFHAGQAIAACEAGKKVVLCEKPLAVTREEGRRIAEAAARGGTAILVGTMHAYDPAWLAALDAWRDGEAEAGFVKSAIYLPTNDVFVGQATEPLAPPGPPVRTPAAATMRQAILGLAVHNIPLVRAFYPAMGRLAAADWLPPFGYVLSMSNGRAAAELVGLMPGDWPPHWTLTAVGRNRVLRIAFPPSYVLAGSARAELSGSGESRVFRYPENGYQRLWSEIRAVARGEQAPSIGLDAAVADLDFALDLADAAEAHPGAAA